MILYFEWEGTSNYIKFWYKTVFLMSYLEGSEQVMFGFSVKGYVM